MIQEQIIKKFIEKFKIKHPKDNIEIVGILGFGSSFKPKNLSKNSDLDIYVVINNIGKRYRGIMLIDNIEVDYFVNPVEQLKNDWEKFRNRETNRKTIAYMLKDGRIIMDKSGVLKKLQKSAHDFLKNESKNIKPSDSELIIARYFINDYLKDIEDNLTDKDIFSWQYNVYSLLNYLIEIYCRANMIPIVKQKYQGMEISKKDKKFVELFGSIEKMSGTKEKFARIKKLALYCTKKLGGQLPVEWELISPAKK